VGLNSKPVLPLKRILIVGLLPRQFEAVVRRIGRRAQLELCSSQDGFGRVMQALHAPGVFVVVNTKFISHKHLRHISRDRCCLCHGGDSTVTRTVEELLA
jgi:hypothetical protein